MQYFKCNNCGALIASGKQQDPNRDDGFGTCDTCWTRYGRPAYLRGEMTARAWTAQEIDQRREMFA